jgi:hypothetical protein
MGTHSVAVTKIAPPRALLHPQPRRQSRHLALNHYEDSVPLHRVSLDQDHIAIMSYSKSMAC